MLANDLSYYVDDELVHLIGSKKQQPLRHRSLLHLPAASTVVCSAACPRGASQVLRCTASKRKKMERSTLTIDNSLMFFNQAGFLRSPCQIPMGAAKIAAILDTNDKQNLTMFRLMRI